MERKTQIYVKLILTYVHTFTFMIVYCALCYMYLVTDSFLWEFKVILVLFLINLFVCVAIWIFNIYCYWNINDDSNDIRNIVKRTKKIETYIYYHSIKISIFDAISFILLIYFLVNYDNVKNINNFGEYLKYSYLFLFYFIFAICINHWNVYNIYLLYKNTTQKSN